MLIVLIDILLNSIFSGGLLIVEAYFCAKAYKDRLDLLEGILVILFLLIWNRFYYYQLVLLFIFLFLLVDFQKSFVLDSLKARYFKIALFFNTYMVLLFAGMELHLFIDFICINNIFLFIFVKIKDYQYLEKKDIVIITRH